jgi:hypothetical protein
MVEGQIEGSRNYQKSLGGQFFQQVTIGHVWCLSDKGSAEKVDHSPWLGIVKVVDAGNVSRKGRTENPIALQVFPVSDDTRIVVFVVLIDAVVLTRWFGSRNCLGWPW